MAADDDWPTELRVRNEGRTLSVAFESGQSFDLSAEYLRVTSPSAEVQGHSPAERKVIGGKRDVRIRELVPVGNYAVKLQFDDGHDTGLYSWTYLRELGEQHGEKWSTYLAELDAKGLNR